MVNLKGLIKKYYQEIAVSLVVFIAYLPILFWMWDRWFSRDSYYSHGILIPFVSIYLIWQMKDELRKIEKKSSPLGLVLVGFGAFIYFLCSFVRVYFVSGFSIILVLSGLVLHFYGKEVFKKSVFPIFFLFFMVPLPEVAVVNISFRLKMLAAQMAANILNSVLHIPAERFGSIIQMRSSQVVVDDICSGLRSLVSLLALGSIFSFWMKGPLYKKLVLFLSSVPIAVFTNMCRVIFLSVVSEIWGTQYVKGIVHDASGFMIFALAFFILVWTKNLLEGNG